jgi:hypothetical protein
MPTLLRGPYGIPLISSLHFLLWEKIAVAWVADELPINDFVIVDRMKIDSAPVASRFLGHGAGWLALFNCPAQLGGELFSILAFVFIHGSIP